MSGAPSDVEIAIAQKVGRNFAGRASWSSREDVEQDAVVALLTAWPDLTARYADGVPPGAINVVITRRLVDQLRAQSGWRRKVRTPTPLLVDELHPAERERALRDRHSDTEAAGLADVILAEQIDLLVSTHLDPGRRARARFICEQAAAGRTLWQIGGDLGITGTRVGQVMKDLALRARFLRISL